MYGKVIKNDVTKYDFLTRLNGSMPLGHKFQHGPITQLILESSYNIAHILSSFNDNEYLVVNKHPQASDLPTS
jgi:hypothetical protein